MVQRFYVFSSFTKTCFAVALALFASLPAFGDDIVVIDDESPDLVEQRGNEVAIDPTTGDIYIIGTHQEPFEPIGGFLAKFNSGCQFQWAIDIVAIPNPLAVAVSPLTGDIYVTGTVASGSQTLLASIARFESSAGNQTSFQSLSSSSGSVVPTDIVADGLGNVYITGSVDGGVLPASIASTLSLSNRGFVARYNSGLQLTWTREDIVIGDYGRGIDVDSAGDIYVVHGTNVNDGEDIRFKKYGAADNGVAEPPIFDEFVGPGFPVGIAVDDLGNGFVIANELTEVDGEIVRFSTVTGDFDEPVIFGSPTEKDTFTDIDTDGVGNVYVAGYVQSSSSAITRDVISYGFDSFLDPIFTSPFRIGTNVRDESYGIAVGPDIVITAGLTDGDLDDDGMPPSRAPFFAVVADGPPPPQTHPGVIVLDSESPALIESRGHDIAIDQDTGDIYLVGTHRDGASNPAGGYLAKFNSDCSFLWSVDILAIPNPLGVAVNPISGEIYVTGTTFGSGTLLGGVARFESSAGQQLNTQILFSFLGNVVPTDIVADETGNVYVTGSVDGGELPGSIAGTLGFPGGRGFIARYDSSLALTWTREDFILGDFGRGIDVDAAGDIYVVHGTSVSEGEEIQYKKFGPADNGVAGEPIIDERVGPGTPVGIAVDDFGNGYIIANSASGVDGEIIRFDTDSETFETPVTVGSSIEREIFTDIAVDSVGNVYVTGHVQPSSSSSIDRDVIAYGFDGLLSPIFSTPFRIGTGVRDEAYGIAAGPDNIIIAGLTDGDLDHNRPEEGVAPFIAVVEDAITLDFENTSTGVPFEAGDLVFNQYSPFGVTITTNDPTQHPLMIFDTANPTGGDSDLGTPNETFGGPGMGVGGEVGAEGENAFGLGNALIISEDNDSKMPNDYGSGGTVSFVFTQPVLIRCVSFIDLDGVGDVTIRTLDSMTGNTTEFFVDGLGNNSVQSVELETASVIKLDVILSGSGAISGVEYVR